MKKLILFILFLLVACISTVLAKSSQKPVINKLEDFFSFENVEQLTQYFGPGNVFTESTYFGDPNSGGKPYLVSQVNFGTPHSVLLVWNREGNLLCEVQTSVYFYDFESNKILLIPNQWKTRQGIHAGMHLSDLVSMNWFPLVLNIKIVPGDSTYVDLIIHNGWIRNNRKDFFSDKILIYIYTLDLKRIYNFLPEISIATLKSNTEIIRKWNPMLELVTIYRDGLKPDKK